MYLLNLQTILMSDHCMVLPDVILETSHIFIAIIQLLFSTRIRRLDFKCLVFPEPRHVRDVRLWLNREYNRMRRVAPSQNKQLIYIF